MVLGAAEKWTCPRNPPRNPRSPAAWTLFELLLVLALLVVLAGLAMPLLEGSFTSLRLRRATDQVLAVWGQARIAAIESGRIHQFCFQPGGGDYLVEPWPRDEETAVNTIDVRQLSFTYPVERNNEDGTVILRDCLPEGIELVGGQRASRVPASGEPAPSEVVSLTAGTPAADPNGKGWSAPILFYPDGTTVDASLLLGNTRKQYQRASLRGLTGSGRASPLIPASELER